jgi:hypothetical protein
VLPDPQGHPQGHRDIQAAIAMYLLGLSLNIVTLLALSVSSGLRIIDKLDSVY